MTLVQLFTAIANAIRAKTGSSDTIKAENFPTEISTIQTGKLTQEEYNEADDDLDDILENTVVPSGTISITTNGLTDVTNYIQANVNVVGENNVKMNTTIPSYDYRIAYYNITDLPDTLSLSNTDDISNMFMNFKSLTTLPLMQTGNITAMSSFASGCTSLVNVPEYDTSKISNMSNAFAQCPSLSNDSLNNIMKMCINSKIIVANWKTLKQAGLSSTQATTCQGLSNYQALLNAGWTTGY